MARPKGHAVIGPLAKQLFSTQVMGLPLLLVINLIIIPIIIIIIILSIILSIILIRSRLFTVGGLLMLLLSWLLLPSILPASSPSSCIGMSRAVAATAAAPR